MSQKLITNEILTLNLKIIDPNENNSNKDFFFNFVLSVLGEGIVVKYSWGRGK